jgi:probable poly-beta-1,6-N-acetyl-D-glucosamine export protein
MAVGTRRDRGELVLLPDRVAVEPSRTLHGVDTASEHAEDAPEGLAGRRDRVAEYDVLRVIAILGVIAIHVAVPYLARGVVSSTLTAAWHGVTRFAVPSFLFLIGALTWTKQFEPGYAAFQRFMRRRFSKVVVPYLFWTGFYLAAKYLWRGQIPDGRLGIPAEIIRDVVTGAASFQLYFVPAAVLFYLVAPFASRVVRPHPGLATLAALAIGNWGPSLMRASLGRSGTIQGLLFLFLTMVPYVTAGAWFELSRRRGSRSYRIVWPLSLLVAGLVLVWAPLTYDLSPLLPVLALIGCVGVMFMLIGLLGAASSLLRLLPPLDEAAKPWGEAVYGVYLLHPAVLWLFELVPAAERLMHTFGDGVAFLLQVSFVAAFSFAAVFLLSRTKATAWIV